MRYTTWVRCAVAGVLLACVFSIAGTAVATQSAAQQSKKVRVIPRSVIHTVNGPPDMKYLKNGVERLPDGTLRYEASYGADLKAVMLDMRSWASNIFLVRGEEVGDAINATRLVLIDGGRYADSPATPRRGSKRAGYWVVVYFGIAGSHPRAWEIKSVEVRGNVVRVNYKTSTSLSGSTDLHTYLFWIPVGKLEGPACVLELFEVERRELMLLRRVLLPKR